MTTAWRKAHPFRTDYNIHEPMDAEIAGTKEEGEMMSTKEGEQMSTTNESGGFRTYVPVDASTVPASSVAFAEQVLPLACADAKVSLMNPLEVKWFREVASGTFTRDSWVDVDCLGSTGCPSRGGWRTIWLKSNLDPRMIVEVLRHECEHISQSRYAGIESTVKGEMRAYYELMAMNAGVRFREKLLPSVMTQLQNRAAEVKRLYGPW